MISSNVLGNHRKLLMGLSIIFIVLCHTTVAFSGNVNFAYSVCKQFLQIGVDIFFMLSGLGCFFSLNKNKKTFEFYWKRVCRIFIPYVLIIVAWGIVQPLVQVHTSVFEFLYSYSLVTFFLRGALNSWYVAAIACLYVVAPLLYKILNKKTIFVILGGCYALAIIVACFGYLGGDTTVGNVSKIISEIFLNRIGIFVIGMWFGRTLCLKEGVQVSKRKIYLAFIICVILFALNVIFFPGAKGFLSQWFITRSIFAPMSICITLFLGNFFEQHKGMKILGILGTMTLEIYLIHEKVLSVLDKWIYKTGEMAVMTSLFSNVVAIILTLLLSWLFHLIIENIQKKIQRR